MYKFTEPGKLKLQFTGFVFPYLTYLSYYKFRLAVNNRDMEVAPGD